MSTHKPIHHEKIGLKLLGDYWTLRIISELDSCERRFCEMQRLLDNLNPTTLTHRLKRLEKAGIIVRNEDLDGSPAVCYALTEQGRGAARIVRQLDNFSDLITMS